MPRVVRDKHPRTILKLSPSFSEAAIWTQEAWRQWRHGPIRTGTLSWIISVKMGHTLLEITQRIHASWWGSLVLIETILHPLNSMSNLYFQWERNVMKWNEWWMWLWVGSIRIGLLLHTHYLSMDRCRHGNYRVSTIYIDTIYRSRVTLGYGGASVEVAVALLCVFGPGAHWHRVRSLRGQPCG